MDRGLRNTLRNTVAQCRGLLEASVRDLLEGQYGIYPDGRVLDAARMRNLSAQELAFRSDLVAGLEHIQATMLRGGAIGREAVEQLTREAGFTHLNRLCAFKILEHRKLIREAVGRGLNSNGFKFYL